MAPTSMILQRLSISRGGLLGGAVAAAVLLAGLSAPAVASAQSVIILGIRSLDGDDDFARNLTGGLRHAAAQVDGWQVSDREVTLAQMALAHGCDDPNPGCMAEIADSLSAERLIYGDVRRTSSGERFDFSVNLHMFNSESDQIEHSVADTIPGVRRDIDDLRGPVRRYIAALSGAPRVGSLRITVNIPGAEIFVDGTSVGRADGEGHLVVDGVEIGSRNVRIAAAGHQGFRSTVSIEAYGEATLEAELEQAGGGGGEFPTGIVVGSGLLVVAGGLAAGWIYSWARVTQGIQNDEFYVSQRENYDVGDNICEENVNRDSMGNAVGVNSRQLADLCSEASALEVLQYVFGLGAAAAAGVGAYFLVQAIMGDDAASESALMIVPSVTPDSASITVRGAF